MEEIYDLLHLHRKKLKTAFFEVHADILPICTRLHGFSFSNQSQAFDPNFLCFSILRSIHLFLGRKPPDAIRRPGGESRCHNLSRKRPKIKAPLPGQLPSGFCPSFCSYTPGVVFLPFAMETFLECGIHMLRGPLFYWCHNGKTRFPLELLEMLFYASDDWNQVVRV